MSLIDRRRPHEENHLRSQEMQQLDALLRIEETLTSILEGMRHLAMHLKAKTVEVSVPADEEKPAPKSRFRK